MVCEDRVWRGIESVSEHEATESHVRAVKFLEGSRALEMRKEFGTIETDAKSSTSAINGTSLASSNVERQTEDFKNKDIHNSENYMIPIAMRFTLKGVPEERNKIYSHLSRFAPRSVQDVKQYTYSKERDSLENGGYQCAGTWLS